MKSMSLLFVATVMVACGPSFNDACENATNQCATGFKNEGFNLKDVETECVADFQKEDDAGTLETDEVDCYAEAESCEDVANCVNRFD